MIGYRLPASVAGDYEVNGQDKVLEGMPALLETLVKESTARG